MTPEQRTYNQAWRAKNPDRIRAIRRRDLAAHPDRRNAYREYDRRYARRYIREHPEWAAANANKSGARRRARIARVLATLTAAEWEAILEAAGHACIYCGSQKQLTQDHLTPISKGGDHTAENVAPACLPCNSSKGAKVVAEFLAEKEA